MKRWLILVCSTALTLLFVAAATAQDTDEAALWNDIVKAVNVRVSQQGKTRDQLVTELTSHVEGILKKCEAYLKTYPKGAHALDVMGQRISAQQMLSQLKRSEEEAAKAVTMAKEMVKQHPREAATFVAYSLLMSNYLQAEQLDEALKVAGTIVETYPEHQGTPQVLYIMAAINDQKGKKEEAKAIYEKLATDFPETTYGQRAKGKLAFDKLKGSTIDLKFTAVDGTEIDLKDYRGKVVLIDFWASWCGPCVQEMPTVVRSYKLMQDKGFRVIGISLDQKKESMEGFIKSAGMTWPQYFDGKGWQNEIAAKYGISAIPQTFLVDKKGVIREIGLRGEEMQRAIRKLLDEKE